MESLIAVAFVRSAVNVFESSRIKNRRKKIFLCQRLKCVTIGKVTGYKIFHTLKFVTFNGEINTNEIVSVSNFALVSSNIEAKVLVLSRIATSKTMTRNCSREDN